MTLSRLSSQERPATCNLPVPFRNGREALCGCLGWPDTPKISRTPPFPAKLGFLAVVKRFGCTAKGEHTSAWSRGPTCRAPAIIAHLGVRGAVGAP